MTDVVQWGPLSWKETATLRWRVNEGKYDYLNHTLHVARNIIRYEVDVKVRDGVIKGVLRILACTDEAGKTAIRALTTDTLDYVKSAIRSQGYLKEGIHYQIELPQKKKWKSRK